MNVQNVEKQREKKDYQNIEIYSLTTKIRFCSRRGLRYLMRYIKINHSDKIEFWNSFKNLSKKAFVLLARQQFEYSIKTMDVDIYDSFRRVGEKNIC